MKSTGKEPMAQNNHVRSRRKMQKPVEKKAAGSDPSPNSLFTSISIVSGIVAILAAVVAIINGWLDIGSKVNPTLTPAIIITATPTIIPSPTPLFTPGPLYFIERPEKIQAGIDVKVVVQAWEGAVCFLRYYTPDGNESNAEGLGPAIPDGLHRCAWVWKINRNTHEGTGRIVVLVGEFEETHPLEILR
jgi:hypothetical protein